MKNGSLFCCIVAILLLVFVMPVNASDTARQFLKGVERYHQKDYTGAAAIFTQLAKSGVANGKLFYNLGNAWFKAGDVGRAILWYERAQKYIPRDPDLAFNLNYARSFVTDEGGVIESPVYRVLFFWNHMFSRGAIVWAAVACNGVFWLLYIVQRFRRYRWLRITAAVCVLFMIVLLPTAIYNYYTDAYKKMGIVLPPETAVRSGLSEQATVLFTLHAGTRVRIQGEKAQYYRIRFSDDKIGWVSKQYVGQI